jgi:DUF2905 family protein
MESVGKIVLLAAAVLAVLGGVLLVAGKLGLDRLPGDVVIRRDGLTIYIPIGLMVLLSVLGSLVLYLLRRP